MGLDMYLSKRTYVKNWDHFKPEDRHEITVKRGGTLHPEIKPERISYIIEEVAYWRKANAIHRWFVENVQSGNDDCGTYYVSREQLKQLVDLCKEVLGTLETVPGECKTGSSHYPDGRVEQHTEPGRVVAQPGIAAEKLPTQSGFFFGGTDYDEFYLRDLEETVEMIEPLLSEEDGGFEYHASW